MKFKIKTPCADCPFRTDSNPFLRRAPQLRHQLRNDQNWFACHETTGVKNGKRIKPADQSHCAGAMGVLWNEGNPNLAMRLALAFKLITVKQLDKMQPVFQSLDDFVRHHAGRK